MALIVYKCTVCDREIQLREEPTGLEVINRCVITDECRGTLYKIDRLEDYIVGEQPVDVSGLTNYIQRKVLYNHVQSIAEPTWNVPHNLGVNPSVQIVVDRTQEVDGEIVTTREEVEAQSIVIVDANNLIITFDREETGLAQCIARSSAPDRELNAIETSFGVVETTEDLVQVSNGGVITIATQDSSGLFPPSIEGSHGTIIASEVDVAINYVTDVDAESLETASTISVTYSANTPPVSSSPWNDANLVYVDGVTYVVRTIAYGDPVNDEGVANGTTVFFNQVQAGNMRVLLSLPPFANVDKNRRQFFRPGFNEGPALTLESFIFADGEFFVNPNVVEDVFPPVYVIS